MRRNPLLYSDPSEIEEIPKPAAPTPGKESKGKSSFFFYLIILANSLLVLFVLGFIWFLFLKSPDIQIKEISNRLFGTGTPTEQAQQTIVAPEIQTEIVISPTQQEKDEIQQTKLKQMREKEELAAERARLEGIKAEIEKEKLRASEAQQVINKMQPQENSKTDVAQNSAEQDSAEQAIEIEQTQVEELTEKSPPTPATTVSSPPAKQPAVVTNTAIEPDTNSTNSQMNLILEALKKQQAEPTESN